MKNISKEKVFALRLPPFSLSEQRLVNALKYLQAETAAELDAPLPAILDQPSKLRYDTSLNRME